MLGGSRTDLFEDRVSNGNQATEYALSEPRPVLGTVYTVSQKVTSLIVNTFYTLEPFFIILLKQLASKRI